MKTFEYNDGGRLEAGYKGNTRDCVTRAIAIVTGKPYKEIYREILELSKNERITKRKTRKSHPRTGVHKDLIRKYCLSLGMKWIPTMQIGGSCKTFLSVGK